MLKVSPGLVEQISGISVKNENFVNTSNKMKSTKNLKSTRNQKKSETIQIISNLENRKAYNIYSFDEPEKEQEKGSGSHQAGWNCVR